MIPNISDRETHSYFEAAAEGRLVIRHCLSCRKAIHPPAPICPHCHGLETEWRQSQGKGRVHTWTRVKHQIHPAYPVPYTIVVVDLDDVEGVRLVGYLDGEPGLEFGQPMEVWFDRLDDGVVLPQWRPADCVPSSS